MALDDNGVYYIPPQPPAVNAYLVNNSYNHKMTMLQSSPGHNNHFSPYPMSNEHSIHDIPQKSQQTVKSNKQKLMDCWELRKYKDIYKNEMKVRQHVYIQ